MHGLGQNSEDYSIGVVTTQTRRLGQLDKSTALITCTLQRLSRVIVQLFPFNRRDVVFSRLPFFPLLPCTCSPLSSFLCLHPRFFVVVRILNSSLKTRFGTDVCADTHTQSGFDNPHQVLGKQTRTSPKVSHTYRTCVPTPWWLLCNHHVFFFMVMIVPSCLVTVHLPCRCLPASPLRPLSVLSRRCLPASLSSVHLAAI